jgi:epoxyqueuosine reductase
MTAGDIREQIRQAAQEAGFELAGVAPVGPFPELGSFERWVGAGYAGEMQYLKSADERGELKRGELARVAPWARSVIVCALNYNVARPKSTECNDRRRGWISRYAWFKADESGAADYHDVVMQKLRMVEARVKALAHAAETRCYVDTGPIVERVYARYAGVGWLGKNTCLLNQQQGSWLFLGVVLTSLEIPPDTPAPDRCGTCTRCLDACPTEAFVGPHELDAGRCISYLTIEKRGAIPEELRAGMGNHLFGCDICQDVCPWNRRAPVSRAFAAADELVNPALEWIAGMDVEEFRRTFRKSPVKRAKFAGLRRNTAIAMGNSGDAGFVPRLKELAADPDADVAEHARWALARLEKTP